MDLRAKMRRILGRIRNYNVFVHDDIDYINDDNDRSDAATTIRNQRYASWLYIILLSCK